MESPPRAPAQPPARDAERARLDAAVKPADGFFTTFFVSPYSKYVARWFAHRGWSPNAVTLLSGAVGAAAAAGFATGERWGLVAGAVLLQAAFTLDCVDGQLARYTGRFSTFGAWLDGILDRAKEYAVYAGLAIGSGEDVWLLAGAALALQTARHAVDFSFPGGSGGAAPRPTPGLWLRRIAGFPIGERLAAISVTAALFDARVTFVVLLICGGAAALYGVGGRVLRALRGKVAALPAATLAAYRDDGPLARPLRATALLGWAGPPLLRVTEYAGILAVGAATDAEPAAFALLCAVAFHHYETVYRLQGRGTAPPPWLGRLGLGWEGRLLAAAAIGAAGAAPAGLYVLAAALGALFAGEAAASWRREA